MKRTIDVSKRGLVSNQQWRTTVTSSRPRICRVHSGDNSSTGSSKSLLYASHASVRKHFSLSSPPTSFHKYDAQALLAGSIFLRRSFASASSPPPHLPPSNDPSAVSSRSSSDRHSILQQTTTRLTEAPIGSFNDQLWLEAKYNILGWLEPIDNSKDENQDNQISTGHGIVQCLKVFDRLVLEEQHIMQESTDDDGTSSSSTTQTTIPSFFHTDNLNLVVNHWRKSILNGELEIDSSQEVQPKELVDRLYRYQETSTHLQPDYQSFGMILDTISSIVTVSSSVSAASNKYVSTIDSENDLLSLVDAMMERLVATGRNSDLSETALRSARPNVIVFSSAMNAWVKSGRREAPAKVEALLDQMKALKEEFPDWNDIAPNLFSYTTAINAWAKVGHVEKVQELLQEMHRISNDTEDESMKPGLLAFNGYLVALAKQGRSEEAEEMLAQMEELFDSGELDQPPNVISYSTVLDGYARSKEEGASHRAEAILEKMLEGQEDGTCHAAPNAVSFNSVIYSHTKNGNIQAAEKLLRRMQDEYLRSGNKEIQPTLETYSVVISGFARSRRSDAGERAEKLLNLMKSLAKSGDLSKAPDTVLYNTVLDCWAKSHHPESPDRAKHVLDIMIEDGVSPDVISFNTLIHCMANSDRLQEAETLVYDMEKFQVHPNIVTYNTLLSAYVAALPSKAKNAQRVQRDVDRIVAHLEGLFDRMKNDVHVRPDTVAYNTVLNFYTRAGDVGKAITLWEEIQLPDSSISPDVITVNTILNALASSGKSDAPEQAEALLEEIMKNENGRFNVCPTSTTFNTVMGAWTKSRRPDAGERCQHLFDLMNKADKIDSRPDFVSYNILIHAWSLSNDDSATEFAELAHEEMRSRHEAGDFKLRPDNRTLGGLIHVWSKSNSSEAGEMAESYMRKIIENAERRGGPKEMPRVYEFTATVRAWANSGDPRAPYKADEVFSLLLQQVERGNQYAQPDHLFFGAFLSTLAASGVPGKGLLANRVVRMMKKFKVRPNPFLLEQVKRCHGIKLAEERQETNPVPPQATLLQIH